VIAVITVLALLIGPVLAVLVSRMNDERRERRQAKLWIFKTMMTTRADRTSADHVRALNSIDLEFYGDGKSERDVRDAWRLYLDHLGTPTDTPNWSQRQAELLDNTLSRMATCLGYHFDPVTIRRGVYSPLAYAQNIDRQEELRKALLSLLNGETVLKVDATANAALNQEAPRRAK
jgi:hypothetical protein